MKQLMCIGGPNMGHTLEVPRDATCLRYTSPLKGMSFTAGRISDRTIKIHTYRVERVGGSEYLVHHSLGTRWIQQVIDAHAKRNKRRRS